MAATTSQGKSLTLFMAGLTAAAAGAAYSTTGFGKVALLLGLASIAVSFWSFIKLKPLEGKVALGAQPAVLKLVGVAVVLLGWLTVVGGLFVSSTIGGRMILALIGLAISLVGVLYILPTASNKNAIWKA